MNSTLPWRCAGGSSLHLLRRLPVHPPRLSLSVPFSFSSSWLLPLLLLPFTRLSGFNPFPYPYYQQVRDSLATTPASDDEAAEEVEDEPLSGRASPAASATTISSPVTAAGSAQTAAVTPDEEIVLEFGDDVSPGEEAASVRSSRNIEAMTAHVARLTPKQQQELLRALQQLDSSSSTSVSGLSGTDRARTSQAAETTLAALATAALAATPAPSSAVLEETQHTQHDATAAPSKHSRDAAPARVGRSLSLPHHRNQRGPPRRRASGEALASSAATKKQAGSTQFFVALDESKHDEAQVAPAAPSASASAVRRPRHDSNAPVRGKSPPKLGK